MYWRYDADFIDELKFHHDDDDVFFSDAFFLKEMKSSVCHTFLKYLYHINFNWILVNVMIPTFRFLEMPLYFERHCSVLGDIYTMSIEGQNK